MLEHAANSELRSTGIGALKHALHTSCDGVDDPAGVLKADLRFVYQRASRSALTRQRALVQLVVDQVVQLHIWELLIPGDHGPGHTASQLGAAGCGQTAVRLGSARADLQQQQPAPCPATPAPTTAQASMHQLPPSNAYIPNQWPSSHENVLGLQQLVHHRLILPHPQTSQQVKNQCCAGLHSPSTAM